MALAQRVVAATTWSVGASAALAVAGLLTAQGWGLGLAGQLVLAGFGTGLGFVLAQLGLRAAVRPSVQRLAELTRSVHALAEGAGSQPAQRLPELGDGEVSGLGAAVNELLDATAARVAAQEADVRLLASLIERSPNGVLVCRPDGRIRMVNPAFRALFEIRGEPVGRLPTEVLTVPEVQELVDMAMRGDHEDEVRLVPGPRSVVLTPIVTDGGEVGVLAQDISAYRAAERARTDFVANVSHELRTPMAAILGYAETLTEDLDRMPDDVRPLVDAIARNSRRLRDTFEGLMHLARVEARLGELVLEPLRLEPLLVQAVLPAVDAAGRKGLDFELDCPAELVVRTNAEALDIILGNVVMNAVKYTREGGIAVSVHAEDGSVRVDVQDTGIGIDAAHQHRIFERFFRVDEGRAREVGGTGLGLAMVKHLALATGAWLTVHSVPGQGSTFSVHLPAAGSSSLPEEDEE